MSTLIEGEDYYLNDDGLMVLTSSYHLRKGKCCGNGCLHCPWPPLTPSKEGNDRNVDLREDCEVDKIED